jgi:translation initiation factor IF-2
MTERAKIGEVFHFYGKIGVAAIRLTDGELSIGDTIQVQGPSTDVTQVVDGMQIEHANVTRATKGQEIGVKLKERAREKDLVYKIAPAVKEASPSDSSKARPASRGSRVRKARSRAPSRARARRPPSKRT